MLFKMIKGVPAFLWTHKFKTVLVIFLIYLARKLYNIYQTWIKPFMSIAKSMKGDSSKNN